MALPSSPNALSMNAINVELGLSGTALSTMSGQAALHSPALTIPHSMSEWWGYEHGPAWGDCYTTNNYAFSPVGYLSRSGLLSVGNLFTIPVNTSETWKFLGDKNETTQIYANSSGSSFRSFDDVRATIYRRAKGSSDSWIQQQTWYPYTSSTYSCDFDTYDYHWLMGIST